MLTIEMSGDSDELYERLKGHARRLSFLPIEVLSPGEKKDQSNKLPEEDELRIKAYDLGEKPSDEKLKRIGTNIQEAQLPAIVGVKPTSYTEDQLTRVQDTLSGGHRIHFLNMEAPSVFEEQGLINFFTTIFTRPNEKNRNLVEKLGNSLGDVIQKSLEELQKIKKVHEKIVPMRKENLKGLKISSKFAAGESSGGEFFDFIKSGQQGLLLVTSSASYVTSSIILSHFERLKQENNTSLDGIKNFIKSLNAEMKEKDIKPPRDKKQLFIAQVDLGKMSLEGYSFGDFQLISNEGVCVERNDYSVDETYFEKSGFEQSFDRGMSYLLLSPGVFQNLHQSLKDSKNNFFRELMQKEGRDIINEVFFQMSRESDGDFLNSDATAVSIEVDAHVIKQV